MSISDSLEVGIGLILLYLLLSLVCSAAREMMEAFFKTRAMNLELGIRQMLCKPKETNGFLRLLPFDTEIFSWFWQWLTPAGLKAQPASLKPLKEFYEHPLIRGLYDGSYEDKNLPAYIPARTFALALLDGVAPASFGRSGAAETTATPFLQPLRNRLNALPNDAWIAQVTPLIAIPATGGPLPESDLKPLRGKLAEVVDGPVRAELEALADKVAKADTSAFPAVMLQLQEVIAVLPNDALRQSVNQLIDAALLAEASGAPRILQPLRSSLAGLPDSTLKNDLMKLVVDSAAANPLQGLRDTVVKLPNSQLKEALLPLIDAAGNDANQLRKNIEDWYDGAMDRVSGWYRRHTQWILFWLGLTITVVMNVNSLAIANYLMNNPDVRQALVTRAEEVAKMPAHVSPTPVAPSAPTPVAPSAPTPVAPSAPTSVAPSAPTPVAPSAPTPVDPSGPVPTDSPLDPKPTPPPDSFDAAQSRFNKAVQDVKNLKLPIGWTQNPIAWLALNPSHDFDPEKLQAVAGWLITALAISLGAPFWFDLLNRFIIVRSTVKPTEKSPNEPPVDR